MVIDHRNCTYFNLRSKRRHGRENRRSLRAGGHSVGSIFHIAAREDFSVREQDGGPDPEPRVGGMRVLHYFLRGPKQSCPRGGR